VVICHNSFKVAFAWKSTIPKEEKVVDYHEVHVKPNSINGLPPFTLERNQVLIVNPPKKPKNSFVVVIQKRANKNKQTWGSRNKKKRKMGKRPTQFQV